MVGPDGIREVGDSAEAPFRIWPRATESESPVEIQWQARIPGGWFGVADVHLSVVRKLSICWFGGSVWVGEIGLIGADWDAGTMAKIPSMGFAGSNVAFADNRKWRQFVAESL